jgi:hypothetical protein
VGGGVAGVVVAGGGGGGVTLPISTPSLRNSADRSVRAVFTVSGFLREGLDRRLDRRDAGGSQIGAQHGADVLQVAEQRLELVPCQRVVRLDLLEARVDFLATFHAARLEVLVRDARDLRVPLREIGLAFALHRTGFPADVLGLAVELLQILRERRELRREIRSRVVDEIVQ